MDRLSMELQLKSMGYIPMTYACKPGQVCAYFPIKNLTEFLDSNGEGMKIMVFFTRGIMSVKEWVLISAENLRGEKQYFYLKGSNVQATGTPMWAYPKEFYDDVNISKGFESLRNSAFDVFKNNGYTNIKEETISNLDLFNLWVSDHTFITKK